MGANMERLLQKMGRADAWAAPGPADPGAEPGPPGGAGPAQAAPGRPGRTRGSAAYAQLLHDEAVLAEGSRIADPGAFARRINDLIAKDAERA